MTKFLTGRLGQYKQEGEIDITKQQHHLVVSDPTSKGTFMMNDLWVRLPNNHVNLVFKIGYDKFNGKPHEPSTFVGYKETHTFYYKNMLKKCLSTPKTRQTTM